MNAAITTKIKQSSNAKDETSGSSNVPSGFILKLYQMVNGAPNEVITVRLFSPIEKMRPFCSRISKGSHRTFMLVV
jgi:hypothetical protein